MPACSSHHTNDNSDRSACAGRRQPESSIAFGGCLNFQNCENEYTVWKDSVYSGTIRFVLRYDERQTITFAFRCLPLFASF